MRSIWGALLPLTFAGIAGAQTDAPPAARPATGKPLREVAALLSKSSGITVLVDSALLAERTAFKDLSATPETLEAKLSRLVKTLPEGAAWGRALLPEPPAGKKYTGDAVAQYLLSQAALFGKAGASEPGKWELFGKQVPVAQAEPLVAGLSLKPFYVLSTSRRKNLAGGPEMLQKMGSPGNVIGSLLKQLGVSSIDQIQPGTYKVSIPGPDGTPMNAEVTVEGDESQRRVMVRMGEGSIGIGRG